MSKPLFSELAFFLSYCAMITPVLAGFSPRRAALAAGIVLVEHVLLRRINPLLVFRALPFVVLPAVSLLATAAAGTPQGERVAALGPLSLHAGNVRTALELFSRTAALSFISLLFFHRMDFYRLLVQLMSAFRLNPEIGYSISAAVNAFPFLLDEYRRIRIAGKMKGHGGFTPLPLLVSAGRYAFQLSLSMQSRGLRAERTYLREEHVSVADAILILLNLLVAVSLIVVG
jgi:energy-coupling factor transporter transmembrane protein EcfT